MLEIRGPSDGLCDSPRWETSEVLNHLNSLANSRMEAYSSAEKAQSLQHILKGIHDAPQR